MANPASDVLDYKRWQIASGKVGFVAFLLVFIAASSGGFSWFVFLLAGSAVFLMWSRNFALVPTHVRFEKAEAESYTAFSESDWIFVDAVGDMDGSEIDAMRDAFRAADNEAARRLLKSHFSEFDDDEEVRFFRFSLRRFVGDCDVYLTDTGRLARWE